jgi:hypothetical protein
VNGYRFNLAVFAVGSVLVAVLAVAFTGLRVWLGGDWPSWPRLVGEIITGVAVMEATNAAAQEVWYWRNKARESEGK